LRLWSLHPTYLDTKGLLAVWREALLAQKVLMNQTKGYKFHPQLQRFREQLDPLTAIATYLSYIWGEAAERNYNFDRSKIVHKMANNKILCQKGQLYYEWKHLKTKLAVRDKKKYKELLKVKIPTPHPLFEIIEGGLESWEVIKI
jgi:hypothetical protein